MISGLKSALRYVLTMAAQRNFRYLPLVKYYDELFAVLQVMVERHFLHNFDCSFSEHLFGLKRVDPTAMEPSKVSFLSNRQRNLSLMCLVAVPYLKDKCESLYYEWKRQNQVLMLGGTDVDEDLNIDTEFTPTNGTEKFKFYFLKLWPYVSSLYEGSHFLFMFLYLLKKNFKYHNPFMYLIGLCLKRISPSDHIQHMKIMYSRRNRLVESLRKGGGVIFGNLMSYIVKILYSLSDYSTHLLLAIAFFFKFFEWYFNNESSLVSKSNNIIPSPPPQPERAVGGVEIPTNPRSCPLCKKERRNATLLTVSGFVFCYKCIQTHLSTSNSCPITRIPCSKEHLVKIFEN